MGTYNGVTNLPCPPLYADYGAIGKGTLPGTPQGISLNTFYEADVTVGASEGGLWSVDLVAGVTYHFMAEGNFTQSSFTGDVSGGKYWAPSDWGGSYLDTPTGVLFTQASSDPEPYYCPYNYFLIYHAAGDWQGGFRIEFTATETGTYRFWIYIGISE